MIGWLKPNSRWEWAILYTILFLTLFRLLEIDYIIAHKVDILGAIIPALQHPFQGSDWQAPYGIIWYAISEAIYHMYPTASGYLAVTALIDAGLIWKIRNHRLVLLLYLFSSWFEYDQVPYNLPVIWMSLLGLINPWGILLGPLTKFPDLPNQIAFVIYTPILSTQGNYNRFWQFWFYFLTFLPSIGILIDHTVKAYNLKRNTKTLSE